MPIPITVLTGLQQRFLEHGAPFLTDSLPRGSGKSFAMAVTVIGEALRGRVVYLYDPSIVFQRGVQLLDHAPFANLVLALTTQCYPDHDFEYRAIDRTFRCLGLKRMARPEYTPVENVLDAPDLEIAFEDDGSEENV